MINSLFEVKTRDRLACVTEQIFGGKNPSSGTSAKRLEKVDRAGVNAGVCSLFFFFLNPTRRSRRAVRSCLCVCVCAESGKWLCVEGNGDTDLSVITERERVILTRSWQVKESFCFHAVPFLLLP